MRWVVKLTFWTAIAICALHAAQAQDLAPRAYVITPLRSNAIILSYAYFNGSILFNGAAPISGATGTYNVQIATYYHGFNFFGRSANANLSLPYGIGTFQGDLAGKHEQVYRSGLLDLTGRLSVNLKGGPAMTPRQMMKWKQKTLLGVSLRVSAPTGQYDPNKLVNWGANRWGFKPEFGYSERWGHWLIDGYAGAWFFTTNPEYFFKPRSCPGITKADRFLRRSLKLRRQTAPLGLSGRKFLGWWRDHHQWRGEHGDPAAGLASWRDRLDTHHETRVIEVRIQQCGLQPVWRGLPECFRGMAVLLAGPSPIEISAQPSAIHPAPPRREFALAPPPAPESLPPQPAHRAIPCR